MRTLGYLLFALAATAACAPDDELGAGRATPLPANTTLAPGTPLEVATGLASRDGWLDAAFHVARPLVRDGDGFRSVAAPRGDTADARFGARATGPFSLRAGKRNSPLAELYVSGIADVPLALEGNKLTASVAPGVTAVYMLAGESMEESVLSAAGAPLELEWHLTFRQDVQAAQKDPDGNLEFVRKDGRALLRIPRPYAVDGSGKRLDVTMTWAEERDGDRLAVDVLFVTPDGHGQPLLVDPALEVVFWQEARVDTPPSRYGAPLVYHPDLGASVVFGGSGFDVLSDTWAYDGTWKQLEPKTGAPSRYRHGMSYVKGTSSLVAFGGLDENYDQSGKTLTWDGSTWTIPTIAGPPSRDQPAMTYAPALGKTTNVAFLFGGSGSSGGELDDSWTWNGTSWHKVTTAGGPDQRYGLGMFYDDARKSVVTFGGARATLFLDDVLAYDGTTWSTLTPAPDARADFAMAFDTKRKTGVLFGGMADLDTYARGTWEWHSDDGTWVERMTSVAPALRAESGMAYDPKRERTVMFGGGAGPDFLETSETWEYGVLGGSCTTSSDCDQYACVDGACCAVDDCGPCSRCSVVTGACEAVTNADDPDSCTGDSTCDENGACKTKPSSACKKDGDCVSGFCSDGVCCNERCGGTCQACDTRAAPGSCKLVTGAPRHGTCDGDPPCGSTCTGDGASCTFAKAGVACGSSCADDAVATKSCDGRGACMAGAPDACPNDLRCADDTVCRTDCAADSDCTADHVCRQGACTLPEVFCQDSATLSLLDGTTKKCGAYICLNEACLESCSSAAQCAKGLVCDSRHRCIKPPPPAAGSTDQGGCGCTIPGAAETRPRAAAIAGLVLLVGGLRRARRRRKARE